MRTNQVLDPATLASPDLLSDMSDVKMSTILCAEQMEQAPYEERAEAIGLEKIESFGLLEQFHDRLEQDKIQKSLNIKQHLQAGDKEHIKIVEIHQTSITEPQLQEVYTGEKTSSRSVTEVKDMTGMISHLSVDMDQYLEQRPVVIHGCQEDLVRDTFEQVIVKHDGKRRPPDIKKPIRKKLRDRQRSGCSSSEGELERVSSEESLDGDVILNETGPTVTTFMDPPASPKVVETPIGSIKDRVRALQDKVEEEAEQRSTQKQAPPPKSSIVTKMTEADMPELPRIPISPKSPKSQTERLEETMSVKDLLKAFQTGQDPSKNKTGLFEHKPLTPAFTSESGVSDTEQEQKSQPKTHDFTDSQQQIHDQTFDKTHAGEKTVDQKQELLSPDRNIVTVADPDYVTSQEGALEVSEKEALSVKERVKTFQVVQDTKPKLIDHKPVVEYTESIEITERILSEEPELQPQSPDILITDIKVSEKEDGGLMPSLAGDNSEDLPTAHVEKTVRFTDIVISDDRSITVVPDLKKETLSVKELMKAFESDQDPLKSKLKPVEHTISREKTETSDIIEFHDENVESKQPELLGGTLSRIQLEEPSISMGRGLTEDMQISPDRRPSEDFSADIKAELEESPEYQLFKQASTASDASYHLMREGDSLFDTQIKANDQSPGSPKQESFAEPPNFIEVPIGAHQTATKSLTFSSSSERENLNETIKQYTTVTQEITESQLQEIYVKRETPIRGSPGVKDMSGMLSLLSTDLDQCIQASPVMGSTPEEEVVHETFEQIVIKKSTDKEIVTNTPDKSDGEEDEEAVSKQLSSQEELIEGKPTTKVKDASGMISLLTDDLENYMERPMSIRFPEEDAIQEKFEEISLIKSPQTSNDEQRTVCESTQVLANLEMDTTREETTEQTDLAEILLKSESEIPFQKYSISQKTHQVTSSEKNMSGMLSLLSSDLDEYLNENQVRKQSPLEESLVHEVCKEDTETSREEDRMSVEELSESETPFQEARTERKAQQLQSVIIRDISGMSTLLTSDLDDYLKEHPLVISNNQEEQVVCETYEEVILRKEPPQKETLSPELHAMPLEDIHLHTENVHLDSGMQAHSTEAVNLKGLSSEEDEVETTVHIKKSFLTVGDHENDDKEEDGFAHSVLETHTFVQQLSSTDTLQRPVKLESLKFVVPDDPVKEPCHPDSLEASPQVEDRSSRTTPDSIEPGAGRESPCPDSLEGSPTKLKKSDIQMPARAAVYEDYASQLEACFAYDKDVYRDESEEEEQEKNISRIESEIEHDMHLESSKGDISDIMFSDPQICSSESLHILTKQDSKDRDDEEENDVIDKQLTPEEKMFKMAAKIKTFEEMEHEEKLMSDITVPLETSLAHHDDTIQAMQADNGITESSALNSGVNIKMIIQNDEIHTELKTVQLVDGSLCLRSDVHTDEHDGKIGETTAVLDSISKSEQESLIPASEGKRDEPFIIETEAVEQISLEEQQKTPVPPSGEKTPDPFQFQEGKLFEMTRGGAIDMTRRSFEGDECSFFHIGELPFDENASEETGEDQKRSDSVINSNLQAPSSTSEDDNIPFSIHEMLVKPSDSCQTPLSAADLGSSTEVQLGSPDASCENLNLKYLQATIADLQSDPSITVHVLGSVQRQPSSDSSDHEEEQEDEEDLCSVIERSSTAGQSNIQLDFQESSQIKTEQATNAQVYEVERKVEGKSAVDRRSRSEADGDTGKASIPENRSYSDSSEPKHIPYTDTLDFLLPNHSIIKPQNPPTVEQSDDTEICVTSSLDTGDISSSSPKRPDSVVFTYDIPTSHSSDSDYNPLLVVKTSSGTEDVFKSQPIQDEMVKTQTQTFIDDQTSQYPSGMARLFALPGPLLSLFFFS